LYPGVEKSASIAEGRVYGSLRPSAVTCQTPPTRQTHRSRSERNAKIALSIAKNDSRCSVA